MGDLIELAGRVERLVGPNRDVDREIARLQGLRIVDEGHPIGRVCHDQNGWAMALPAYTRSLDAAMSLVPEGWGWLVSQPNEKAIASGLLKQRTPVLGEVQYGSDQRFAVAAATPALALCAASLRARASDTTGKEG